MFALPKWLTDIKKLFGTADGKLLGRTAGEWEFVDPPVIPTALADLTEDATHRTVTDDEIDAWNGKEDAANRDTDGTLAANSDAKYPSQKAVKTYVDAHAGGASPVTKIYTHANFGGF